MSEAIGKRHCVTCNRARQLHFPGHKVHKESAACSLNSYKIQISPAELKALAKNSIGIKDESLETILILKIERLLFIQKQIVHMNNQLRKFVKENIQQDFDIVTSISGI